MNDNWSLRRKVGNNWSFTEAKGLKKDPKAIGVFPTEAIKILVLTFRLLAQRSIKP